MGRYSNQGEMASDLQELLDITPEPAPIVERKEKQFHHRLYPEEIQRLIADYRSGVKVKELAIRYQISRNTVIEHVKQAGGVRHRYPALLPAEIAVAVQLYQSGQSLVTVGKHFGINASTVRSALLRAGLEMRDCQGREG
jgi:DNA invertase Pin-like site-specific DNA recombinase